MLNNYFHVNSIFSINWKPLSSPKQRLAVSPLSTRPGPWCRPPAPPTLSTSSPSPYTRYSYPIWGTFPLHCTLEYLVYGEVLLDSRFGWLIFVICRFISQTEMKTSLRLRSRLQNYFSTCPSRRICWKTPGLVSPPCISATFRSRTRTTLTRIMCLSLASLWSKL